jgi:hypothetical protein
MNPKLKRLMLVVPGALLALALLWLAITADAYWAVASFLMFGLALYCTHTPNVGR